MQPFLIFGSSRIIHSEKQRNSALLMVNLLPGIKFSNDRIKMLETVLVYFWNNKWKCSVRKSSTKASRIKKEHNALKNKQGFLQGRTRNCEWGSSIRSLWFQNIHVHEFTLTYVWIHHMCNSLSSIGRVMKLWSAPSAEIVAPTYVCISMRCPIQFSTMRYNERIYASVSAVIVN